MVVRKNTWKVFYYICKYLVYIMKTQSFPHLKLFITLFVILSSSVALANEFRQHRYNNFLTLPPSDNDDIKCIGDSCSHKGQTIFNNKDSEVPYRIPAIATTKNGNLIALADYRYSKADIGMVPNGKLDIRYRIKDSYTGEWGQEKTLAKAYGEGDQNIAFGDPCVVADRLSDNILVTCCSGNVSFPKGTHENHQGWVAFLSEDGGESWSEPWNLDQQVFDILDKRADGPIQAFFIASGKITQSNKIKNGDFYRLYCAALVKTNDKKVKANYVFYSDDFGKNWNLLGEVDDCPVPAGADEAKTEELPDGSVMISSRISGGRLINIFKYTDVAKGEGKWMDPAESNKSVNGVIASSNACNGEIMILPVEKNSDNSQAWILLQSVPLDSNGKRAEVGINYKILETTEDYSSPSALSADWDGIYMITPESSAYSTMSLENDNSIAFFYEENVYNGGYDLIYKKITIDDITDGAYSYKNDANEKLK